MNSLSKVILFSVLSVCASGAQASCPSLNGRYAISAEPFQGNEVGHYGTSVIQLKGENATSCIYSLRSQVSVYADPLETGMQTLSVRKQNRNGDFAIQLSSPLRSGVTKGVLNLGRRITLIIQLSGCGGEGGASSSCGEYIYFN